MQRDVKQNKIMTFIDRLASNDHTQHAHSFEVLTFRNQGLLVWIGKQIWRRKWQGIINNQVQIDYAFTFLFFI